MQRVAYPNAGVDFSDFPRVLREHVLNGFIPAEPPLSRSDVVVTQGSCFAENIHTALCDVGVQSVHFGFMEILNSPWANRVFLEYVLEGRPFKTENHRRFFKASDDVATQIKRAAMIIFTVGVAWAPVLDNEVLLGYTSEEVERMEWKLTSVHDNARHIKRIIQSVRKANPAIRVLLTVSPIPIKNAFSGYSAVVADCASKSNLRAAVEQVLADGDLTDVSYWPSFEAIRWISGHAGQAYGTEGEDQRHPGKSYIRAIVDAFTAAYFKA